VTDLLESERLASPHVKLHREPTDLAQLMQEVCEAVITNHPHQVSVKQDVAHDLPKLALDATRIRLLLRNLLDNALRHNGSERPIEAVSLTAQRTAEGGVRLRVGDFGAGVEDAALPHLAQPFYRPDAARERSNGGVGLGLYLCKLVTQAHGGSMVISNAHPGLEVTVILPAS
jgi:signal transduction histidine kinase